MAVTITSRMAGLMVAGALAAGWVGASLTQSAPQQAPRPSAAVRPAETQVPRAEKLRERLAVPPLPSRGRNPFVFAPRVTTIRDHQQHGTEAAAPAPAPPVPLPPPLPVFKLSGIASSAQDGTTVLTAIIIDNGSMVFAKAGDKLSNGFSVVRIDEMSVTLVDATGVTQTIRLP